MQPSTFDKQESENIQKELIVESQKLGFDTIGFTSPASDIKIEKDLNQFLKKNYHGEMQWLEKNSYKRSSPIRLWPEVKSIITLGVNYGPNYDPLRLLENPKIGNISVYAQGEDYHKIIKKNLKKLGTWIINKTDCQIKVFVDTAPVMEKNISQESGIGWQGKHTNLVSREFGSWLFLGEIFTNIEFLKNEKEVDHCGSCNKCIKICPTNAFDDEYRIDPRKCISYLTIEHKSSIPIKYRKLMGNRIYGCDDCLAICPWNKFAKASNELKFLPMHSLDDLYLSKLSLLDDKKFREFFSRSPIKRIGRNRFVRNVMIAIGNSKSKKLVKYALKNLYDESPLVRGASVWAIKEILDGKELQKIKNKSLNWEKNKSVIYEWDADSE